MLFINSQIDLSVIGYMASFMIDMDNLVNLPVNTQHMTYTCFVLSGYELLYTNNFFSKDKININDMTQL